MHVLLVAATPYEIVPLRAQIKEEGMSQEGYFLWKGLKIEFLVTGVGQLATAARLSTRLAQGSPEWLINVGVAGSLRQDWELGKVVQVISERPADLGVEEADGRFTDVFEMELWENEQPPFLHGKLHNPAAATFDFLPKAKGITVNKVHGTAKSIAALKQKYPDAEVESMEGAAVFFACLEAKLPFLELRALSNYVEPRNKEGWELGKAINNLTTTSLTLLQSLSESLQESLEAEAKAKEHTLIERLKGRRWKTEED